MQIWNLGVNLIGWNAIDQNWETTPFRLERKVLLSSEVELYYGNDLLQFIQEL